MTLPLGYSTYALSMVDPFEALPKIKEIGYEAVEIAMGDIWPTSPERFTPPQQIKLASLAQSLGFPSPLLFGNIDVCALDDRLEMDKTLTKLRMANRLHYDDSPLLITTTAGQSAPLWDTHKQQIRDAFMRLADLAAEHNATIAIEPHAGTDFETPEKAKWMMEHTDHPNLTLDLDISHFYVEGAEVAHSVETCAPYASMVHIKDGEKVGDKVQYCLPGAGTIDIPLFLRSLQANGLSELPVFAEVSVQQSSQPDYDPWAVAKFCYDALRTAEKAV